MSATSFPNNKDYIEIDRENVEMQLKNKKIIYPESFKTVVKTLYPNNAKLHSLLGSNDVEAGKMLRAIHAINRNQKRIIALACEQSENLVLKCDLLER